MQYTTLSPVCIGQSQSQLEILLGIAENLLNGINLFFPTIYNEGGKSGGWFDENELQENPSLENNYDKFHETWKYYNELILSTKFHKGGSSALNRKSRKVKKIIDILEDIDRQLREQADFTYTSEMWKSCYDGYKAKVQDGISELEDLVNDINDLDINQYKDLKLKDIKKEIFSSLNISSLSHLKDIINSMEQSEQPQQGDFRTKDAWLRIYVNLPKLIQKRFPAYLSA